MSEEQALVPQLRFPEFRHAGEWELKKLGDKNISIFIKKRVSVNELVIDGYVGTENILPDFSGIKLAAKLPSSGSFTSYQPKDILVANIRPYLKKVWVADRNGAASNDVVVVRPMKGIKGSFLSSLLRSESFINYVMKGAKGVKMPRGDIDLMKEYSLAVPCPEEQHKIADCLSSLDKLIAAQAEKIEALKTHKKGLMQQFFPREGETIPCRRFPEFRDAGKWEEKKLSECCHLQAGKFVRASDIYEQETIDKYPCYGGNGIRGYTKTYTHSGRYPLVGRQGAQCGNVNFATGKFHATEHAVVAKANQGVDTSWLFYNLMKMNLNQYATGQAQPGLSVENLDKLIVCIPENKKEQQKIADCLSSLDVLIAANAEKVDALKAYKKGLMQQLFPSTEADVS